MEPLPGFAFAKASPTLVDSDSGEPGFEVGLPAESGQSSAGGVESILRGVLRFGLDLARLGTAIVEDGEGQAVDIRVMFTDQGFEGMILVVSREV